MTADEALKILDVVLKEEPLSDIQELVLRQIWNGQTYEEASEGLGYDVDYIKHVGSKLFMVLSKVFGRKVSKSNYRSVIRKAKDNMKQSA
jgi:hypothetical protein